LKTHIYHTFQEFCSIYEKARTGRAENHDTAMPIHGSAAEI
jgi:hypothetical protein